MAYYDDLTKLEYGTGLAERGAMGLMNRDPMLRSVSPSGFGIGGVGTAGEQKFINTTPSATNPMASNMQMPAVSSMLSGDPRSKFYTEIDEGKVSTQLAAIDANTKATTGEFERAASSATRKADEIIKSAELTAEDLKKKEATLSKLKTVTEFAVPAAQAFFSKDKETRKRAMQAGLGQLATKGIQAGLDAAFSNTVEAAGQAGAAATAGASGAATAAASSPLSAGAASGVGSGIASLASGKNVGESAARGAAAGAGAAVGSNVGGIIAGPPGAVGGKIVGGILGNMAAGLLGLGGKKPDLGPGRTAVAGGLPGASDLLRG